VQFATSADHEYFRAIELEFIRLRVTPLMLSPDDYQVAKSWRAAGVPLELALRVLAEKVIGQQERGQDVKRRLSYYRKAVLNAWETDRKLQAPAAIEQPAAFDTARRLDFLADTLIGFPTFAIRIRQLQGTPEDIERELESLEGKLLEAAVEGLDAPARALLETEAAKGLAALARRLPGGLPAEVEVSLRRRITRRLLALPALSLFGGDPDIGAS
jgi:hypothetical protein